MKRPCDQAKLLFFALLRSSATAIATGEKSRLAIPAQNIQLRLATRFDVNSIQRCNLECLPENYNSNFYASHLRQWPDLALIAEDVSEAPQNHSRLPFSKFSAAQPEPKIIAYVLGKIESRPIVDYENPTYGKEQAETLGHVTSLAVQDDFRRLGLAKAMMTQLHHHLQHQGIKHCGLHVRTSNEAACRLYQNDGYEIAQIIPSYYQDGEDAYFMRKTLPDSCFTSSGQSLLFGNKIWKTGPDELRLPRSHTAPSRNNMQPPGSQHASPELLTGTM